MGKNRIAALLAFSALISPMAASAQALTADEILALLQAQREQLAAGLGAERTLEFVTESTPEATTEGGMALVTELPGDALAANTEGSLIPEEMVIDLTIFFEFDSALLKSESKSQVDALCSAIQANEAALMASTVESEEITHGAYQIIGHTDASGSVNYNLSLSQARADEVVRYMVRECGIDGNVLQAVGMGEGRLKDAGNPRADQNRRVEIQVVL
ncbi:MAG: OmpA family protein [Rhodobacteraceae bacterium]|nr:OmpA family protein [Paracoccaceae bacterium]